MLQGDQSFHHRLILARVLAGWHALLNAGLHSGWIFGS